MGRSDADTVKSAGINAHELGGALPVAGAIPGLAKGTTSIELASRAEKAAAAKTEALEPGAYGKGGCVQETQPPGEARRGHERLPEEGKREQDAGQNETARSAAARSVMRGHRVHLRGSSPWDPGGDDWGANPQSEKAC